MLSHGICGGAGAMGAARRHQRMSIMPTEGGICMSGSNFKKLRAEVLSHSAADNFIDAAKEWGVVSIYQDPGETCVCGKAGLRWCYRIRNRLTGQEIYPIGDVCIHHFGSEMMDQAAADMRLVLTLGIASATTPGIAMPVRSKGCGGAFSRASIDALLAAGALAPRDGDGLGGLTDQEARDLLTDEFNARNFDPVRAEKAFAIVERRIRPALWHDLGIRPCNGDMSRVA